MESSTIPLDEFSNWFNCVADTPVEVRKRRDFIPHGIVFPTPPSPWLKDQHFQLFRECHRIQQRVCTAMAVFNVYIIVGFADGWVKVFNSVDNEVKTEVNMDGFAVKSFCTSLLTNHTADTNNQPSDKSVNAKGFIALAGNLCRYIQYKQNPTEIIWQIAVDHAFVGIYDTCLGLLTFDNYGEVREIATYLPNRLLIDVTLFELNTPIDEVSPVRLGSSNNPKLGLVFIVTWKNYLAAVRISEPKIGRNIIDILFKVILNQFRDVPLSIATDHTHLYLAGKGSRKYINGVNDVVCYPLKQLISPQPTFQDEVIPIPSSTIKNLSQSNGKIIIITDSGFIHVIKRRKNTIRVQTITTPAKPALRALINLCNDMNKRFAIISVNDYSIITTMKLPLLEENGVCRSCLPLFGELGSTIDEIGSKAVCLHFFEN